MAKWKTIKEIETALKECHGMQTYAAKMLGITYQGLWQRIKKSDRLTTLVLEIEEASLDKSEVALMKNIKAGKEASIFFHLKCKGKKRGYIERVELDHRGQMKGGDVTVNVTPKETVIFSSVVEKEKDGNSKSRISDALYAGQSTEGNRIN